MKQLLFAISIILVNLTLSDAQTAPVTDCLGAIPVCQQIYTESSVQDNEGDVNEINPLYNCMQTETNSTWYTFTVNNTGEFGFLLTPNSPIDDYDWALFNITNASCDDLFDNPDLIVSCNAAGGTGCIGPTGATGDTQYSNQGFNCGTNPPTMFDGLSAFNDLVPVLEGNTYVLCVSNWSGTTNGYEIDFGLSGDIGIFDEQDPFIENLSLPEDCSSNEIAISFSEPIQCNTVDDLNFQLTGPGGPYSLSLSSPSCDQGGSFANDFLLTISPPPTTDGDYELSLITDGINEVLDPCDNPAAAVSFAFNPADLNAPANLGPDQTICDGDNVVLDVFAPNASSYLWQDGSTEPTFLVTTAGTYFVDVITPCGTNSDTIEIGFQTELPPIDFGADLTLCFNAPYTLDATTPGADTYIWQDGSDDPTFTITESGTFSVTVSGECGETSDEVNAEVLPEVSASLDVISLCGNETITWDVTATGFPDATYLWQDGTTDPVFIVSEEGIYAVTISTECEEVILEATVSQVEEAPSIDLGADLALCPDEPSQILDATFEGATYLWQDGSTSATLEVSESGVYAVTVTNGCGVDTDSVSLIRFDAIESAMLRDTVICPGESVTLDATALNATSYRWSDGSESPTFTTSKVGDYTVFVANDCEQIILSSTITECEICEVYVPTAFSPNSDGVNDEFKPFSDCTLLDYHLRIFNRWGALVFESTDPELGWDGDFNGKTFNMDSFIWTMEYNVNEDGNLRFVEQAGAVALLK